MEPKVQVAGRLNTPAYEWPLKAGVTFCVLAPISYGLRQARIRGFGRLRFLFRIMRWIGPTRFLMAGAISLVFALAVRRARQARRRDLEVSPDDFAIIDRSGTRNFRDSEVQALGFRSRSAPAGTVATQRGRASLWVDGRDGPDRLDLDWEYPDAQGDPLAGFLGRVADRLHAQAIKTIESGSVLEGEGWELSKQGLQMGHASEFIPFTAISQAEYHDGQLLIWTTDQAVPEIKIEEGSRNDAILHAILIERMPGHGEGPNVPGLGRLLFERRPPVSDRVGFWVVAGMVVVSGAMLASMMSRRGNSPMDGVLVMMVGLFLCVLALGRQRTAFRCHERGVVQSRLLGVTELRFADLIETRVRTESNGSQLKVAFRPVPDRGLKPVTLVLPSKDEALQTLRDYVPGGLVSG